MGGHERMSDCLTTIPSPDALFKQALARFSSTVLGGGVIVPGSPEWWAVTNDAMATQLWHTTARQMLKELDPRSACCDNLVKLAALDGVYPRPAMPARAYVKISGTPGTALSDGLTLTIGNALFRVDAGAAVPPMMPEPGFVYVRFAADVPGASVMSAKSGTINDAPAGLDPTVLIAGGDYCGGAEAETCEVFRSRYLDRLSHVHMSRFGDMVEDIMEWPCVTRVCRRECSCCADKGRLELYVFMDRTFAYGIPPHSIVDEMSAWYFGTPSGVGMGVADFGIDGQFYAARPRVVNVSVSNLPCSTPAQLADIQGRIARMFSGLCPGAVICRRMIDAIVISALGFVCDFSVVIEPLGAQAPPVGDEFKPSCDELPVPGTISVTGGSLAI